jgi:hypothetical protein
VGSQAFNPYVSAAATHSFITYSATVCIPQVQKMEIRQFCTQTSYCQRRTNSVTPLHLAVHINTELSENPTSDIPDIRWAVWRTKRSTTFAPRLPVYVPVQATKHHLAYPNLFNVTQARHSMYDAQTEEISRYQNWGSRNATMPARRVS